VHMLKDCKGEGRVQSAAIDGEVRPHTLASYSLPIGQIFQCQMQGNGRRHHGSVPPNKRKIKYRNKRKQTQAAHLFAALG